MERKNKGFEYYFSISADKLRLFKKLPPEERFQWLEDAHEFVASAVPYEQIKRWKLYIKRR